MESADGHILVIGAAGFDIKGKPYEVLTYSTDNPGKIRNSFGGVARNIAENLARLELNTVLLSAVGDDPAGQILLAHTAATGVNVQHVLEVESTHTGTYLAILDDEGDLSLAVSDFDILEHITPEYLKANEGLFESARLVAIDLSLPAIAIQTIIELAEKHDVKIFVDPTSPAHSVKICNDLDKIFMIAPNASETKVLCGKEVNPKDFEGAIGVAKHMRELGVSIVIVTLGEDGVVYASDEGSGHVRGKKIKIIDSTGAGDALSASVIFGLINDLPLDEAMQLGIAAATLTLHAQESVHPDLSIDRLYENL